MTANAVAKPGPYIPISVEVGLDFGWWPWLAPDRNPMPRIDLFPRSARAARKARAARRRAALAWDVLRNGHDCRTEAW